jgi:hypothetical protein
MKTGNREIYIPPYDATNSENGWMDNHMEHRREDGIGMWDFERILGGDSGLTPEEQESIKQQYINSPSAEKDLELYEKTFRDINIGEGREAYFSNLIAEYAHLPEYDNKSLLNRPLTSLKRAYRGIKEGKKPDNSNYTDPHDFEYKTHTGPDSYEEKLRSKYELQEGGERERFINFLKDNEGGAEYIRNKNSVTKKIVDDEEWDGESYHKIFDEDSQKHYAHIVGDEKAGTIGYGHHNKDVLKNFPNGITETKALEMLGEDADAALSNTEIWWNSKYKSGDWEKLDESTQYMLADIGYNVGHIREFPKFANAINTGDFELAEAQYKRYDNNIELGRNATFMEEYLKPWMDVQKEKIAVAPPFDDMPLPIGMYPIDGTLDTSDPFEKLDDLEEFKDGGSLRKFQTRGTVREGNIIDFTGENETGDVERIVPYVYDWDNPQFEDWQYAGSGPYNDAGMKDNINGDFSQPELNPDYDDFKGTIDWFKKYSTSPYYKHLLEKMKQSTGFPEGYNHGYQITSGDEDTQSFMENPYIITDDVGRGTVNKFGHRHKGSRYYTDYKGLGSTVVMGGDGVHDGANRKGILAHELGHTDNRGITSPEVIANAITSRNKLLQDGTIDEDHHDARPHETRSDLIELRHDMQEAGIFDSNGEFVEFTIEDLEKAKNKKGVGQRLFKYFEDEDIIWFMNNIANASEQIQDDLPPVMNAKYGGQHNWALDRRPISNAQKGKEIKSDDVYSNDRYSNNASKYKTMLPKYQSEGAWNDFEKSKLGKIIDARGLRGEGEHLMATIGDYFGYENTPEDARRMSLDATAMINPMPDFINAYDHAEQGKYTDAALYAGFGIFPFSAGPLVRGTKEILKKGKKAALESFTHLTNPNTLPKPSTTPLPKQIGFNQKGQVIPQQHMVNTRRGEAGVNDALNSIYDGEPMWFAPTGDKRYLDRSGYTNGKVPDFVSGQGQPIYRSFRERIGNTGKKGINEFPLESDFEKSMYVNNGFWDEAQTKPILRNEPIQGLGYQNKIEGVFAPDTKFKIFESDLSKGNHAMHHKWSDEEFKAIKDGGYDVIQLVDQNGNQIENILLNDSKFKPTHIDEMQVHIDNPPFRDGGSLPKAQNGWNDFEESSVGKFVNAKGLRQDGEHFMNTVGDYFGYDEDEGKDLALDATAIINPAADFIHAGTKFDEGEYLDAGLYAGFGILPFAAGPLVKGVKNKIINPIKNAFKSAPATRGTTLNKYNQIKTSFDDLLDAPKTPTQTKLPKYNSDGLLNVPNIHTTTRNGTLPLRNGQLDMTITGEGTQDFMVQVNKSGSNGIIGSSNNDGMQLMTRLDVPNAYYIDMSMTNQMDAGQTMKYLEEFMPKGSTISSKTSLSMDSYKLMLNRVKRGKFSVIPNQTGSSGIDVPPMMDLNMMAKQSSAITSNNGGWVSRVDAAQMTEEVNKMLKEAGVTRKAKAVRMAPDGELSWKVIIPNLTLKMQYQKGGEK